MKDQDSRFYPCTMTFGGEWCGGIAVFANEGHLEGKRRRVYVCQKCLSTWTERGYPTSKREEWSAS